MPQLQAPLGIRGMRLRNRIVMLPMYPFSFHGDDGGFFGAMHRDHYIRRAEGGAGLVIAQAVNVLGVLDGTGTWSKGDRKFLADIAAGCRREGAAAMLQLAAGDFEIHDLDAADIARIQRSLEAAAAAARDLGFDGVEFHFAHGYTLCKFLDAGYNTRTDAFGGDLENRARILVDLLPRIRDRVGEQFVLAVRMGVDMPAADDGEAAAAYLARSGIDLLDISFGLRKPAARDMPESFPGSPVVWSGVKIQRLAGVPTIVGNGVLTGELARTLAEDHGAELIGIGRSMFTDPDFALRAVGGSAVNACRDCPDCRWFTDHTRCPGLATRLSG